VSGRSNYFLKDSYVYTILIKEKSENTDSTYFQLLSRNTNGVSSLQINGSGSGGEPTSTIRK
jgi:hypothetical protein